MSKLEMFRSLYDYNEWASVRVLDAASRLTEEELLKDRQIPRESIAESLRHIAQAQHGWWSFWAGVEWHRLPGLPPEGVMDTLRRWFKDSHDELRAFRESLVEDRLDRVLTDTEERGSRREFALWEMMLHVVNHGTQHRGEIGAVLASLGASPGDLDYVYYVQSAGRGG